MEEQQVEEQEYDSRFGVIAIGAPGVGKTTFCDAFSQFLSQLERPHCIVNLDPANENMNYKCGIDVRELISHEEVMQELKLGPNGSMIYCMEFLEKNLDWLYNKIKSFDGKAKYFIFDLPGQVELYSNHDSLRHIIQKMTKDLNFTLSALHLVDCTYLYDKHRFLSAVMLSLTAIIGMEMPFINVISKVDLMKTLGRPDMHLFFYSNLSGLEHMFMFEDEQNTPFQKKFGKLTKNLSEVIEKFALVGYVLMDIHDKFSMCNVLMRIDKSNGYFYDAEKVKNPKEREIDYEFIQNYFETEGIMDLEERYLEDDDEAQENVQSDQKSNVNPQQQ